MQEPLLSLAPTELRNLAAALRGGRLCPPYSPLAVERFVGSGVSGAIAARLAELTNGDNAQAAAQALELLAASFDDRPRLDELVNLVVTGPEVVDKGGRDTSVVVSELFRQAEQTVTVVGYAVHKGQRVFRELASRMSEKPDLHVQMFLDIQRRPGDTSAPSEIVRRFQQRFRTEHWPGGSRLPQVYYDERSLAVDRSKAASLHAKCVIVDHRDVFISSANFTEAAQTRNVELGVVLRSEAVARRIGKLLERLKESGVLKQAL